MKSRAVRFLLLTLFVGSLAATAYVMWDEEAQGRTLAAATRTFDDDAVAASRLLLELRHAQSGYVAAGQGDDFWAGRVDTLFGAARDALTALQGRTATGASSRAIEEASAAVDDFQQMDRRARSYARNGQRLLASDLVFSDGLERIELALAAIDRAREAEQTATEARRGEHRRTQLLALAGAAGVGLLVTLLLVPLPRASMTAPAAVAAPPPNPPVPRDALLSRPAPASAPVPAPRPPSATEEPRAVIPPPRPTVDLPGIASLCTDLAQVLDMQALPPALERAAALLHASGIVIWISDPDGRELSPVIAHGYPPELVARIGTINRQDENATAAAFRTGLVQIVRSRGDGSGAIAAPLITPAGAVGVMAAELARDGADEEPVRAAAGIIAAQLSTLVGPPVSRSTASAGGA